LGFYTKAYNLLMLPVTQINAPIAAVAIPALSRLGAEPDRYRRYYLQAISAIAFVSMPLVAFLIVMSREVILVLLGPQWNAVWPIFTLLGIAALGQPISNTAGWLYVSQGRTRDILTWGIIGSSITVVAIIAGLPWGVLGVAASYAVFNLAAVPLFYWFLCRKGPVRARDILRAVAPFLWVSFCVLAGLLLLRVCVPIANPLLASIAGFVLTMLLVPPALVVFPGGKGHLRDFLALGPFLWRGHSLPEVR
jgi:PST family polysaccharide transporter